MSGSSPSLLAHFRYYSRSLGWRLLGLALGLSVFITIPLRARNQAPINWGNPVDWDGFWWLTSGTMYHGRLSHFSFEYLFTGLRLWSQFLLDQTGIIGVSIALIYIVVFFRSSRLHLGTIYLVLIYSIFAILYFSPDSYIYLILPMLAIAIWIALGCERLLDKLPPGATAFRALLISGSIALVVASAIWAISEMDISTDQTANEFAQTVLDTLPEKAIIISQGDETLFALWYFHFANGQRPDVSIISNNLSAQEWYRESLRTTYPGLSIPGALIFQSLAESNPQRPVCLLSTDLQPRFECLPNTVTD